jgi:hypothetical protein
MYRRSLNGERPLAPSPDGLGLFPVRPVMNKSGMKNHPVPFPDTRQDQPTDE